MLKDTVLRSTLRKVSTHGRIQNIPLKKKKKEKMNFYVIELIFILSYDLIKLTGSFRSTEESP